MPPICEIRIPTYKRPAWLKRALESVLVQDYPYWHAIVIDDSPEQEGCSVTTAFTDSRITYHANERNLGAAGNLDKAFKSGSLASGTYACVLEDDNWLRPAFLSENIKLIEQMGVDILLRNQEVWQQSEQQALPTQSTTRGDWFEEKIYTAQELHAYLFFFEGISNGGLFWKTTLKSNLQVGPSVTDPGLQEHCRTLQIMESLGFATTPLSIWSSMPATLSTRQTNHRQFGRGRQSILRYLLQNYDYSFIEILESLAQKLDRSTQLRQSLIQALNLKINLNNYDWLRLARDLPKAYAKYLLAPDPLKNYFRVREGFSNHTESE